MENREMRSAFSMLMAIFVIMLMATVGVFVMSLSGKTVKATIAQYQHEQAELYAKSYTEYAILAVTGNDRSIDCLETISGTIGTPTTGNGYRIRTQIAYIVNGSKVDVSLCSPIRVLSDTVIRVDTPLTIVIDAYVDYKDPDNTSSPWWFTVHRRSVQKI